MSTSTEILTNWINGRFHKSCHTYGITNLHEEYEPTLSKTTIVSILGLPAGVCAWHASPSGGCTICGFNNKNGEKSRFTVNGKPWPNVLTKALIALNERAVRERMPEVLSVFNGGSFLNPDEVPKSIQSDIFCRFASSPYYRKLFFESRPEYITEQSLSAFPLHSLKNSKAVEVGIGLESADDYVRNKIINKGIPRTGFLRAVEILKDKGFRTAAYVFLKPQELSEQEAIDDAVATCTFCFESGIDSVYLASGSVQEETVLYSLWKQGSYRPPWLWSVIEVLKKVRKLSNNNGKFIRLGSFEDDPPPLAIPFNCKTCSGHLYELLNTYRRTNDEQLLYEDLSCQCYEEWKGIT